MLTSNSGLFTFIIKGNQDCGQSEHNTDMVNIMIFVLIGTDEPNTFCRLQIYPI